MPKRTRVFISYSHDSEHHLQFVLELAERLIEDGFNCVLDFYLDESPDEGWHAWLETELATADFALVICTPDYLERYRVNKLVAPDTENFSGLVITEDIYNSYATRTKFVPVLPEGGKLQDIIPPLQGQNTFELMLDYLGLHQLLKNRPIRLTQTTPQATGWSEPSATSSTLEQLTQPQPPLITPLKTSANSDKKNKLFFYLAILSGALILGALIALLEF